ncbi:MAG: ribonucleoside-diphosphate reductase subunit alpha, partial [Nevskia sp.]|nr:ribonucleoside-diphosphate reductase subunit alpha [Nevskia sp.]
MYTTQTTSASPARLPATESGNVSAELAATAPGAIKVIRRNGKLTNFDARKISIAMTKAFLAVEGGQAAASSRVRDKVEELTEAVVQALTRHLSGGGTLHIEDIQDQVELALMRGGEHKVARDYVIYRDERAKARAAEVAAKKADKSAPVVAALTVKLDDGRSLPLDEARLQRV